MALAFYVSGHGFGHASRTIEIINALLAREPDLPIVVLSSAPRWIFDATIRGHATVTAGTFDTGIAQVNSLALDVEASLRQAAAFHATIADRARTESERLRHLRAALVLADLPPLAFEAAARAGVPSMAIGNFTWDWIYEAYELQPRLAPGLPDLIRQAHGLADVAWRLPMHGGFEGFRRIVDVPLVARRSRRDPTETRRAFGLPPDTRLVLISFGGYGLDTLPLHTLVGRDEFGIVTTGRGAEPTGRSGRIWHVDEQAMYDAGYRYEDLVAAVDVVATKPGYGIISECAANGTALLYTSRGPFAEYDVLVAALPGLVRSRFIDHARVFAGGWDDELAALLAQPKPHAVAANGADVIAERILERLPGTLC